MIAVIFEAVPRDECAREYLSVTGDPWPFLEGMDGCLGVERFESLSEPGKLLAISFWRDEAAVHIRQKIEAGREEPHHPTLRNYRIRVARILLYSATADRTDCPEQPEPAKDRDKKILSGFPADGQHARANNADTAP